MNVERNLRTPDTPQHGRYVRVVGDGTAEGTRVLQMNGEPVPERVVGFRLSIDPHECAQGVFWHVTPAGDTEMFVAWVVFEPPPIAGVLRDHADRTVTVESFVANTDRDLEFNGDSLREAIEEIDRQFEETEERLGTPPEARLTIPGPPLAELLAAKREGA